MASVSIESIIQTFSSRSTVLFCRRTQNTAYAILCDLNKNLNFPIDYFQMRFAVEGRSAVRCPLTFSIASLCGFHSPHPLIQYSSEECTIVDETTGQRRGERSAVFIRDTLIVGCKMFTRLRWLVGRQNSETLYECRRCGSTFETDQRVCSNCKCKSIARYDFR